MPCEAEPVSNPRTVELIVVDASRSDEFELVADIAGTRDCGQFELVHLAGDADGVDELTAILASRERVSAVHLVTSGSETAIRFGNLELCIDSLTGYASDLVGWGDALRSDAEIVVHGCDLMATEEGILLLDGLSALVSVQVATAGQVQRVAAI